MPETVHQIIHFKLVATIVRSSSPCHFEEGRRFHFSHRLFFFFESSLQRRTDSVKAISFFEHFWRDFFYFTFISQSKFVVKKKKRYEIVVPDGGNFKRNRKLTGVLFKFRKSKRFSGHHCFGRLYRRVFSTRFSVEAKILIRFLSLIGLIGLK